MKKSENLKIVYRNVSELIPYVNNARTHSEEQVTQIAASIKEFGFNNPILIDKDSGVIAGHGRLMAAKKLGLETVPTVELSQLTESQRKAYIIADNKLALNAQWDFDLLKIEISDIEKSDLDAIGFNEEELNSIMSGWESDLEEPKTDFDESKETIRIHIDKEFKEQAKELIEKVLEENGIEFSY